MEIVNIKKYIVVFMLGIMGIIMFCPFNFTNGQTCIVDRWLNSNFSSASTITYETRLHRYVVPYGLLWWSSIGLVVVEFLRTRYPQNKDRTHTNRDKRLL